MVAQNFLAKAPPYPVEGAIKRLGANLRKARIRRKMTIADAAVRVGTGVRAVMDAEKGKPSTSIAVYSALLWLYDLLGPMDALADPLKDDEGLRLEASRSPQRVRKSAGLDNNF